MINMKFQNMKIIRRITSVSIVFAFALFTTSSCKTATADSDVMIMPEDANIVLSEAQIQLANIKVTEVKEGTISTKITLPGSLKINEQSSVGIASRAAGRIEKLFFKTSGEKVSPGDSLYSFYSEDVIDAERDYFTLQSNNWNITGEYPPSLLLENDLQFYGLTPAQMKQLRIDGKIKFVVTILSQVNGTIRSVYVTEGQYVKEGEKLFELAEDNTLWMEALAYPGDIGSIGIGTEATITIPTEKISDFKTKINYINPTYIAGQNVILVRTALKNSERKLFPGMFALLSIEVSKKKCLIIPVSSVIFDKNENIVWLRNEDGTFSAREIQTGIQSDDSIEVLSGLEKSDVIVTSGAYLLNSESILQRGTGSDEGAEL